MITLGPSGFGSAGPSDAAPTKRRIPKTVFHQRIANSALAVLITAATILLFPPDRGVRAYAASNGGERAACRVPDRIEGHTELDPDCIYDRTIKITQSDVVLDCRGAVVDVGGAAAFGIEIGGVAGVENVKVKDCKVRNATNSGVLVGWRSPASIRELTFDMAQRYAAATKNISLENVSAERNGAAGIYILAYSQDVRITKSTLSYNEGVGVYIGPHSVRTRIEWSLLRGNGFGGSGRSRSGLGRREGVAVDSSGWNIIRNNVFENNGGGVYTYKNCQEFVSSYGRNFKRIMPASHNQVVSNTFKGGGPAVWIASRQSRNLSSADCGDDYYGDRRYVVDHSKFNIVARNVFRSVWVGVIVEDDDNAVIGNATYDPRFSCIVVGAGPRSTLLKKPVVRTLVDRNRCRSSGAGYVFAYGADSTGFKQNVLNGRPAREEIDACATDIMPFRGLGVDGVCQD